MLFEQLAVTFYCRSGRRFTSFQKYALIFRIICFSSISLKSESWMVYRSSISKVLVCPVVLLAGK